MSKTIRISIEEIIRHLDHAISIEYGSASFHGEIPKYEYSIWCDNCKMIIGNSIIIVD